MAKAAKGGASSGATGSANSGVNSGNTKKTFEERLERLEELGDEIRRTDIPLDDAIQAFEEGIKLARTLEKDLEKIESRIEILVNGTGISSDEKPELGLFDNEA